LICKQLLLVAYTDNRYVTRERSGSSLLVAHYSRSTVVPAAAATAAAARLQAALWCFQWALAQAASQYLQIGCAP
jgi:hypothetical protein